MHKIKITNCKNHIEEITLASGSYTIGRSLDSTLRLEGEEVSRLHARLFVSPTRCELIDEGSKNGTLVNGNRIASHYLNDGDIIRIGRFNLKYISDNIKPEKNEKSGVRHLFSFFLICLVIIAGFFFYQNRITKKTLAQRTAQYLAERNKEALYLGEYASIDLTNLPTGVIQVAIWDRNGILRAGAQPPDAGGPNEINIPIYYESVRVGTLWMKYKL